MEHLIEKDTLVAFYTGEAISTEEYNRRLQNGGSLNYMLTLELKNGDVHIDASRYGNIARFFNHACMHATLKLKILRIEGTENTLPHAVLYTTRTVHVGEELTFRYIAAKQNQPFDCCCDFCQGKNREVDTATLGWTRNAVRHYYETKSMVKK